MDNEFERARRDIGGRTVTITSWYDGAKETWSAGAPAYRQYLNGAILTGFPSRNAAIQHVASCLRAHFGEPES